MPRIPEPELQRLKDEVSVQRLVESSGVELKKAGRDWLGRCPFHQPDTEPSLVVTPGKNLWHCFGCQIGGGPIDWVMKSRGVSFRHAVELLKADLGAQAGGGASSSAAGGSSAAAAADGAAPPAPAKRSTVRLLPAPVALDADDRTLLNQAIDYYHQRLKESPAALDYSTAPDFVLPTVTVTGGQGNGFSGAGRFLYDWQDELAAVGSASQKLGQWMDDHPALGWGLMAVQAATTPLLFAGQQALEHSPIGERINTLTGAVFEAASDYVDSEGAIGDKGKAALMTIGGISALSLAVGGLGML